MKNLEKEKKNKKHKNYFEKGGWQQKKLKPLWNCRKMAFFRVSKTEGKYEVARRAPPHPKPSNTPPPQTKQKTTKKDGLSDVRWPKDGKR